MSTFEVLPFFRGVSAKYPTDRPFVITPRRDRQPKNSPSYFHEIADQWFKNRFGIAYRSGGVFVTSSILSAVTYGAAPDCLVRVVPLSRYSFCWSPNISDLLFAAQKYANSSRDIIEECLESASYREDGLEDAHAMRHEVMLYCEQYVAIPVGILGINVGEKQRSIILSASK